MPNPHTEPPLDAATLARMRERCEAARLAPSGEGPLAAEWKDKPHRLVYDLAFDNTRLLNHLAAMQEAMRGLVEAASCAVIYEGEVPVEDALNAARPFVTAGEEKPR